MSVLMIFIVNDVLTSQWHNERCSILDFLLEHLKISAKILISYFLCNVSNRINNIWGSIAYGQNKWDLLA